MKNYAVLIYLGKDKVLRFLPQIDAGILSPILHGIELPFTSSAEEIGKAYLEGVDISLSHYGEEPNPALFVLEYKAFKGFSSMRKFAQNHLCISSYIFNNELVLNYIPKHKNDFYILTTDWRCKKIIPLCLELMPYGVSAKVIGENILNMISEIDKALPEYHLLGTNESTQEPALSLTNNQTTLFVKGEKATFKKVLSTICDVEPEKDSFNEYTSYAAEEYSCFVEESIENLHTLSKSCGELFCFASYSVVGFYGFFHFKNGKCLRAFATLDEDGTVQYSIGNPCRAEKELKLDLPKDTDQMIAKNFLGLDFETLQKIAQLLLQ